MSSQLKSDKSPSKRRIFVVEDHPVFCEGLVHMITAEDDMQVCGKAGDGKTAFERISQLKPDLALIDLGLPEKSGLDLIKEVRASKLPVKLLAVSMFDEAIYAQRVLRAGGDGYIMKQEDTSEILDAIRDVLAGRIYVSEEVLASGSPPSPAAAVATPPGGELNKLTDAELELLEALGEGKSNEEIAGQLQIAATEVATKCEDIQHKLDLKSINGLIRYAVCWVENSAKAPSPSFK